MKLKLHTQSTETLKTTLSLITHIRKYVIFKFAPDQLVIILVNAQLVTQEPQVWCKFAMESVFDQVEVQSLRDNTILLELNVELLLQALKNFDKANTDGLNIRLQRKDSSGGVGVSMGNGRTASLALFYSNINLNSSTINHTFRIPVKILKNTHEAMLFREPEVSHTELLMRLPNEFVLTYKRLEKFKKPMGNETVTIRASQRGGGFLGFVLEEEGKYKVTISWNDKIEVQKLKITDTELLRNLETESPLMDDEEKEITVRLRDWQQALRIVAQCKLIMFLMTPTDGILHCLLDDSDDVEITYFISGLRLR